MTIDTIMTTSQDIFGTSWSSGQSWNTSDDKISKEEKFQADQSLLGPSLSRHASPFSSYSALVIQNSSLSFMTSASTAPPMNTISFLLGGSSILILNLASRSVSPLSTLSR